MAPPMSETGNGTGGVVVWCLTLYVPCGVVWCAVAPFDIVQWGSLSSVLSTAGTDYGAPAPGLLSCGCQNFAERHQNEVEEGMVDAFSDASHLVMISLSQSLIVFSIRETITAFQTTRRREFK